MIVLVYVFFALLICDLVAYTTGHRELSDWLNIASDTVFAVIVLWQFLDREWGPGFLGVAVLLFLAWLDWRKRKRRKAAEALGAKAKARRDALVRKVRESLRPSPVRVPVPVREGS